MMYLWAVLLVVSNLFWLVLTLLTLPGNWLMVGATGALAWCYWEAGMFSPWTLAAIIALAAGGEVLEFLASAMGVSKAGGTRWAGLGSVVGAVAGAIAGTFLIPVPLFGSLIGACLGAAGGAWAMEAAAGRGTRQSVRVGVGAGAGRLFATVMKFGIGVIIYLIIAVAAFWP